MPVSSKNTAGALTIEDFVRESNAIEGIPRVLSKQVVATREFLGGGPTTVESLVSLVAVLQPNAKLRCVRNPLYDAMVGDHIAPPSGPKVLEDLEHILQIEDMWEQHCAYETLHPFTDGNGRSGRALWLKRWLENSRNGVPSFLQQFYYQTLSRSDGRK